MGNELFDIVNPTYLHSLHDIFSDKTKCAVAILNENTQPITPESGLCDFCNKIRQTDSGLKICRESDRMGMKLARQKFKELQHPEPVFYRCLHGLIDFCSPIVVGNEIMGYLMGGQFRYTLSDLKTHDPHDRKPDSKLTRKRSPKNIFRELDTSNGPELDRLLAEAKQKNEQINKNILCELFAQTQNFDLKQFKAFHEDLKDLTNLLNAFIAKVRNLHKPEQAYRFMQGVIGIENVEDLYELMVNELPSLFDAVGASIFVVHHDDHEGDRLVLQKTSFADLKSKEKTAYYNKGEGLTGWVWASKRCLRIQNLQNPQELKQYDELKWNKGKHNDSIDHSSFLAVPMFEHTGEVLGVLRLPHKMGHIPFTSDDEIFLRFLAVHLSRVIECQAAKDIIKQATGPSGLTIAAAGLFAARSQKEILNAGLNSSILLFEAVGKMHFMNLLLHDSFKWKIKDTKGTLAFEGEWRGRHFSIYEGLTGKVLRKAINATVHEGDIKYDLEDAIKKDEYVDIVSNARSAMAAPIIWGNNVYGAIAVASEKQYEFTREKDLRLLENLAVLIGIALHNYEQHRSKIIKVLLCLFRLGRSLLSIINRFR